MHARLAFIAALPALALPALALTACGPSEQPVEVPAEEIEQTAPPLPEFDMELPGPGQTDPADLTAYWKGAVEAGDTDAARRAWRVEVRTGGTAPRWANLSNITVAYGDGREEGAAGSLYYTVPVTLTGYTVDEVETALSGTMTLRRANDVPGADADRLSWRIASIDWDG